MNSLTISAFLTKEEVFELVDAEAARLVSIKDIEELLRVPLVHFHAIDLEHLDDLFEFQLPRSVLVKVLKYFNDIFIAVNLRKRQQRAGLR